MPKLTKENQDLLVSTMKDICGPMVAEAIEANMAPWREKMDTWQSKLTEGGEQREDDPAILKAAEEVIVAKERMLDSAARVQGMIQAIAAGRGDPKRCQDWYYKTYGDDEVCKALAATDATAGGFTVPEMMAADVIELLRPASVVRRMNPQLVDLTTGTLRMPRITSGVAGTYIGENENMSAEEQIFGQVIASAKKLAVLVPVSNDLIRRNAGTNTIVRDDMVRGLSQTSDLKFIRSDGLNGEPKGLRYWANTATTVPASVVTEEVLWALGQAIYTLMNSNVMMTRAGWLMAPRTWNALLTMTTSTGNLLLRDEMTAGRLMGFPFAVTSQIPTNLSVTGSNESELYFADFADVVLAESTNLILDASSEAAYYDGSNVQSAYSRDQTVVRAIMEHDLVVRHEESIFVYTDVDWGVSAAVTT